MDKKKISELNSRYWKTNLKVVGVLLVIWAIISCVLSIILVEPLNSIKFGGFPLGFWIAQQGSIISFIVIILTYALMMNRIDATFEKEIAKAKAASPAPESTPTAENGGEA